MGKERQENINVRLRPLIPALLPQRLLIRMYIQPIIRQERADTVRDGRRDLVDRL